MRDTHTGLHHGSGWAPASRVGRRAVALAAASVTGVALSVVGFATGVLESASGFSDNWLLTGWGLAILASGAASAIAGALAIVGRRDRSWTVLLATVLGVCVLVLLLNEVVQGL